MNKQIDLNFFRVDDDRHIIFDHIIKNYSVKSIAPLYYQGLMNNKFGVYDNKKIYIGRVITTTTTSIISYRTLLNAFQIDELKPTDYSISEIEANNADIATSASLNVLGSFSNQSRGFDKNIVFTSFNNAEIGIFIGYEITLE